MLRYLKWDVSQKCVIYLTPQQHHTSEHLFHQWKIWIKTPTHHFSIVYTRHLFSWINSRGNAMHLAMGFHCLLVFKWHNTFKTCHLWIWITLACGLVYCDFTNDEFLGLYPIWSPWDPRICSHVISCFESQHNSYCILGYLMSTLPKKSQNSLCLILLDNQEESEAEECHRTFFINRDGRHI